MTRAWLEMQTLGFHPAGLKQKRWGYGSVFHKPLPCHPDVQASYPSPEEMCVAYLLTLSWAPRGLGPGVRGLCEGQQGRRAHGTVFPGVGAIAVWLLADVGLHQSRHNCIHFGDTAWRSQWFGGSWHNGWYRSVSLIN